MTGTGRADAATATAPPFAAEAPAVFWCAVLLIDGVPTPGVRLEVGDDGRIARVTREAEPRPGDVGLGTVLPGMANAHSHAFHRALRGRTHAEGGDFWRWRQAMYRVAGLLDPDRYFELARAVFAEMLVSGYTAVGEFHYLHHRPDGGTYPNEHAMELALAHAARAVGIRLVLLDTLYLAGGIGAPLEPGQRSFGDGSAAGWLHRWHSLAEALGDDPDARVGLGAAIHSVRAVPPAAIREVLDGLPGTVPLHIHLSEQPQENADCLAAHGRTPAGLLSGLGALTPRLSVVHATHLSDDDVHLIGASGAAVVMCPSTEADLGDGIGPARRLADAGARIALGSDQNAVVDPLLELRGLEAGERLASGRRGRFDPAELLCAATSNGYACLGLGEQRLRAGDLCDLVEVSTDSVRTVGSAAAQLPLTATASDVRRVVVHGVIVADSGRLVIGAAQGRSPNAPGHRSHAGFDRRPELLMRDALAALDLAAAGDPVGGDGSRDTAADADDADARPAPLATPPPSRTGRAPTHPDGDRTCRPS